MPEANDGNRYVVHQRVRNRRQMDEVEDAIPVHAKEDLGHRRPRIAMRLTTPRAGEGSEGPHERRRCTFDGSRGEGTPAREDPAVPPRRDLGPERGADADQFEIAMEPRQPDVA
jgi:hypothetical protein